MKKRERARIVFMQSRNRVIRFYRGTDGSISTRAIWIMYYTPRQEATNEKTKMKNTQT